MASASKVASARAKAIGERVSLLVDLSDGGSVNNAAQRAGISQAALQALASGRVANPRADSVFALARTYGVDPEWILNGVGAGPAVGPLDARRISMVSPIYQQVLAELKLDEATRYALWMAT